MNCPKHRRKLIYEKELSTPRADIKHKILTYYCSLCEGYYVFRDNSNISQIPITLVIRVIKRKEGTSHNRRYMKHTV